MEVIVKMTFRNHLNIEKEKKFINSIAALFSLALEFYFKKLE